MLFVIYIFLLLFCILKPNSKRVFFITAMFLWFLAAFCTLTADTNVYELRYNGFAAVSSMTEPGYTLLMSFFNRLGLSYEMFLAVIYAIILGIIACFIWKNSVRPNTTLALYAIFSYSIDMVQMRNTLAFSVSLLGIDAILNQNSRKSIIKFLIFVAIGSSIHFSVILFIFLLVPILLETKRALIVTGVSMIILGISTNVRIISNAVSIFVGVERASNILARISRYASDSVSTLQSVVIICVAISVIMLLLVRNNLQKDMFYDKRAYDSVSSYETKTKMIINFQLVMLMTLPIISFVLDVYRLNRYLLLIAYVGFSFYRLGKNKKQFIDRNVYTLTNYVAVSAMFYVQIYALNNFYRAFWTFFKNNTFF